MLVSRSLLVARDRECRVNWRDRTRTEAAQGPELILADGGLRDSQRAATGVGTALEIPWRDVGPVSWPGIARALL